MKQPSTTIDLSQQLDEFKNFQVAIPRLHHWELIEGDTATAYQMPCTDVSEVSLGSAFRIGDRLPAIHGASLFSLSTTMIEFLALKADGQLDNALRKIGDWNPSLQGLERTPDLSQVISNVLIFGFSTEGLLNIRKEVTDARRIIEPWLDGHSDADGLFPEGEELRGALTGLERALEQTSKMIAVQALLSSVYDSKASIQYSTAQELCHALEQIESPIDGVCRSYGDIMGKIVQLLCNSIEEDSDLSMREQERMVREFVDPIDEARPLLSNLRETVNQQLFKLRAEINDQIASL